MPGNRRYFFLSVGCLAVLATLVSATACSSAAFDGTKRYQVIPFEGSDLICESYTFSSDEDPLTVFQQKGEISQVDFIRFLRILRQINPNLSNPLQPKPDESVLIPLRFEPLERSVGEARSIDVPMLAIPDASAAVQHTGVQHAAAPAPPRLEHVVQPGENLFRIVLRYFGTTDWQKRVDRILQINPQIGGVNRLRAGQRIVLETSRSGQPMPSMESAAFEPSNGFLDLLKTVAFRLKATLLASGFAFFPKENGGDFCLDLRRYPLLETPRKTRVVIDPTGDLKEETVRWIRGHWKETVLVTVASDMLDVDALAKAVGNAMEATGSGGADVPANRPNAFRRSKLDEWVAGRVVVLDTIDRKRAIERLLAVLGLRMQRDVLLSFPYAGTQIQTVGNLVELPSRKPLVIDFGEFGGDAAVALQACSFQVLQFSVGEDPPSMMRRMLKELSTIERDAYRMGPWIEAGVGAGVDRIELPMQRRTILLLMEPVASDRIEHWLREGFDLIVLDTAMGGDDGLGDVLRGM
ncbi:MAG: LysM peptidoglycan-binding domain-containing protein [Thermodesulfobacteriota bacterium]